MKFNDLYDFIMENIPEEEWEAFYSVEPVENVNYIGGASHYFDEIKCSYVFARQRDADNKNIYFFKDNVHGEAWRQEFYDLFYDFSSAFNVKIVNPDEQFRKTMINYLISEYLFSSVDKYRGFYKEKYNIFLSISEQMPTELRSYLGNRKNTAIRAEYWVHSRFDSDEQMLEIVSKDKRFKGKNEKQFALDIILSIRDFFKYFPFVGVERKVA